MERGEPGERRTWREETLESGESGAMRLFGIPPLLPPSAPAYQKYPDRILALISSPCRRLIWWATFVSTRFVWMRSDSTSWETLIPTSNRLQRRRRYCMQIAKSGLTNQYGSFSQSIFDGWTALFFFGRPKFGRPRASTLEPVTVLRSSNCTKFGKCCAPQSSHSGRSAVISWRPLCDQQRAPCFATALTLAPPQFQQWRGAMMVCFAKDDCWL